MNFQKIQESTPDYLQAIIELGEEGVKNLLRDKDFDIVVKVVARSWLQKDDKVKDTQEKMKNTKEGDKPLDGKEYEKGSDGKYTEEAMIRFLYEKEAGISHKYNTEQKQDNPPKTPEDKGHLAKY